MNTQKDEVNENSVIVIDDDDDAISDDEVVFISSSLANCSQKDTKRDHSAECSNPTAKRIRVDSPQPSCSYNYFQGLSSNDEILSTTDENLYDLLNVNSPLPELSYYYQELSPYDEILDTSDMNLNILNMESGGSSIDEIIISTIANTNTVSDLMSAELDVFGMHQNSFDCNIADVVIEHISHESGEVVGEIPHEIDGYVVSDAIIEETSSWFGCGYGCLSNAS